MSEVAKLILDGKTYEFPIIEGTENEKAIDISALRNQTGYITMDNGFLSTGSTKSSITYLDGQKGILRYRGYNLEDLCENSTFLEVAYLLINGELPKQDEFDAFSTRISRHTLLNEDFRKYYDVWPKTAHPMGLMSSALTGMSSFYRSSLDPHDPAQVEKSMIRILAKVPTLASYAYKKFKGQPFVYPQNKYNYVENFLNMMFSLPMEEYQIDQDVVDVLNKLLIIHADHEQNCSTSTGRFIGSSHANLFTSISGSISALWGPLHGGANQSVLEMLEAIHRDGGDVSKYVKKAKDKSDPFRLMGFGHRVYKSFDPRAKILKNSCDKILKKLNVHDPLLDIAKKLEKIALEDEYFVERNLYPNVDFYSGIIYKALGFPVNMFTVLFTMGRAPGWIAHWKEMIESPETKICRPRQVYTGATERKYININKR